jgi:hypothetical protein
MQLTAIDGKFNFDDVQGWSIGAFHRWLQGLFR